MVQEEGGSVSQLGGCVEEKMVRPSKVLLLSSCCCYGLPLTQCPWLLGLLSPHWKVRGWNQMMLRPSQLWRPVGKSPAEQR